MPAMTFERAAALRRLTEEKFDVLVVGGGITGAGCALDAASRGLRVALVEKDDFASGTSSRSSKFVHGGLRYLQQGEVRLVYEALRERRRLMRNAPHLVQVLPFLLPVLGKGGVVPAKVARALGTAMWMYDATGGARIGKVHRRLSAEQAVAHMPTLRPDRVVSGYLYYDAAADDARLTLTVVRTAVQHGAVAVNGARLVGVRKDASGQVCGADVDVDGSPVEVSCRAIVNASGVWADDVRSLDEGHDPDTIRQAKGVHLVLPRNLLRNDIAVVLPVPDDRRSIFVAPWGDFSYVGTTDTDDDSPPDEPRTSADEVAYLLGALNASLTEPVSASDVVGTWAGLRPLVRATSARTADLSRRHGVATSSSGVVTVIGGKLTTYRQMAADTIDAALIVLGESPRRRRCRTTRLRLVGAEGYEPHARSGDPVRVHLAGRYGSEAAAVLALIDDDASLAEPLVPGLPYLKAEAVYAVRAEMARSIEDVLSRRTRARLLDRAATMAAAEDVAALIGPVLGWSDDERARQVSQFRGAAAADFDLVPT